MKCLADPAKLISGCLGALVFTGLAVSCICEKRLIPAFLFAAMDAYFIYNIILRGAVVNIDDEKIVKRVLGLSKASLSWSAIAEVGMINNKYIYFSTRMMDEDERFDMCFHWPPKDKIYLSSNRLKSKNIEALWENMGGCMISFETGKIKLL